MINSNIKLKCKCGKPLTIHVRSIDVLQKENSKLKKELRDIRVKLRALEMMRKTQGKDGSGDSLGLMDMFKDLFK